MTMKIGMAAMKNPEEAGSAAFDYLMYSGYVTLAYFWAAAAQIAAEKLGSGSDDGFYKAKLQTARFYYQRLLPRTRAHLAAIQSGAANLLEMNEADFLVGG